MATAFTQPTFPFGAKSQSCSAEAQAGILETSREILADRGGMITPLAPSPQRVFGRTGRWSRGSSIHSRFAIDT